MKERLESRWLLRGTRPHIIPTKAASGFYDRYYVTDQIPATVPGGVHLDLFRAGIIENPYVGYNSLHCEWVENRWWIYETTVYFDPSRAKSRRLIFEGLDYECDIYIDDELVGSHANMFSKKVIDVTHIAKDRFDLMVVLRGVPDELGQWGATSKTFTQKSRFGYGWDFATHLVNIGIWRPVYLEYVGEVEILDPYVTTDCEDGRGLIDVRATLAGSFDGEIAVEILSPDGKCVEKRNVSFTNELCEHFEIASPQLWYPNGMGAHPLYTVSITAGEECYTCKTGIRRLRYQRTEGAPEDALPYAAEINGERIYLRGNNKTPFDHLYGNVDHATYDWYVRALANENVNLVRVWGGGIIETDEFYELCDEYGILVWQDFIQSSSGYEHIPSKIPSFLKKLRATATEAVKGRRNHVCLTYWCGGNEVTDENRIPATYADENIAMLKEIVGREDPMRLFLPTTSSGPTYVASFDVPNHDAHGPWYYGFGSHYKNYDRIQIMLHAEFGVCSPADNTDLFMSENVGDSKTYNENCHHGEFWWHSYRRDRGLFGEFDSTDEYTPYGQWAQAEALRYIIEAERRKAPRTCGSNIWQLNEPWPTADCSSLVSYFGIPKMAYYWAKKAFSDCGVSAKLDGICGGDAIRFTVCRPGDLTDLSGDVQVGIYKENGECLRSLSLDVADLPLSVSEPFAEDSTLYMVRLTHRGIEKDYFLSKTTDRPYMAARDFAPATLICSFEKVAECGEVSEYVATVKNMSDVPAYFVSPYDATRKCAVLAEDGYFTLLPNEERSLRLTVRPRLGLFFEKPNAEMQLAFKLLNPEK